MSSPDHLLDTLQAAVADILAALESEDDRPNVVVTLDPETRTGTACVENSCACPMAEIEFEVLPDREQEPLSGRLLCVATAVELTWETTELKVSRKGGGLGLFDGLAEALFAESEAFNLLAVC